jgi:hypothetical protein
MVERLGDGVAGLQLGGGGDGDGGCGTPEELSEEEEMVPSKPIDIKSPRPKGPLGDGRMLSDW